MWKGETREGREQFPATGAKPSLYQEGKERKGEVAGTMMTWMREREGKKKEEERTNLVFRIFDDQIDGRDAFVDGASPPSPGIVPD